MQPLRSHSCALLSALFFCTSPVAAQDTQAPRPQLILLELDPWLMVIGSDSPEFVLYDDGLAIYRAENGYRALRLDPSERRALLDGISLAGLEESYEGSKTTDQRTNIFIDFRGERPVASQVYGSLVSQEVRAKVPAQLSLAYDRLHQFDDARAAEWVPEKIEVMIWPYEYAPDGSIHWPADWPGLDDEATRKRGEDSYSIYVPSSERDRLLTFLDDRKQRGAVEIGGKKWAVSLRYPFPAEDRWMAAVD